jgi:hypothetical protein
MSKVLLFLFNNLRTLSAGVTHELRFILEASVERAKNAI